MGSSQSNFASISVSLQAILIGLGLQHKTADELAAELELPTTQLLGLFNRTVRKISQYLTGVVERQLSAEMDSAASGRKLIQFGQPVSQPLADELDEEAKVLDNFRFFPKFVVNFEIIF